MTGREGGEREGNIQHEESIRKCNWIFTWIVERENSVRRPEETKKWVEACDCPLKTGSHTHTHKTNEPNNKNRFSPSSIVIRVVAWNMAARDYIAYLSLLLGVATSPHFSPNHDVCKRKMQPWTLSPVPTYELENGCPCSLVPTMWIKTMSRDSRAMRGQELRSLNGHVRQSTPALVNLGSVTQEK